MPSPKNLDTETATAKSRREFKVNKFLTLKLENGRTNIYIKGRRFSQCKYLLLNVPVNRGKFLDEIDSIDEAAAKLGQSLEGNGEKGIQISPDTEFWGHCSNLQVWAEYDYDTRLLHSNLAFPLLKKLSDVGDPMAIRKFKEEVARRIQKGGPYIIEFVLKQNYLDLFTKEELNVLFQDINFSNLPPQKYKAIFPLLERISKLSFIDVNHILKEEIRRGFKIGDKTLVQFLKNEGFLSYLRDAEIKIILKDLKENEVLQSAFGRKNEENKLIELNLSRCGLCSFPKILTEFTALKKLDLSYNNLETLPTSICKLKSLEELNLEHNRLKFLPKTLVDLMGLKCLHIGYNCLESLPEEIGKLKSLTTLNMEENKIKLLPDSIGNLEFLQTLLISKNKLKKLPKSVGNLKSLINLNIRGNLVQSIPKSIGNLTLLKELDLSTNNLRILPQSIGNLISLEVLNLRKNKLECLPTSIGNLKALEELWVRENYLKSLPKSIKKLRTLKKLELFYNNFTTIPKSIFELTNLEELWLEDNIISFLFSRGTRSVFKDIYNDNSFTALDLTPLGDFKNLKTLEIHSSTKLYWYGHNVPDKQSLPKVLHRYYPRLQLKAS